MESLQEKNQFHLEWCSGKANLDEVLALRALCFPGLKADLSAADLCGQHLIIRDSSGVLCGAYRVTLSSQISQFESEDDFNLSQLLSKVGLKAELAWACVHPEYRDGRVIHLLWRGLSEFFKEHKVRYVFGLASVTGQGSDKVLDIISYLKGQNYVVARNAIQARKECFSETTMVMERSLPSSKKRLLPSLLRAYLMAGALVCSQPVFDPDLDCYDFMTVLDVETASSALNGHFNFR